MVARTTNVQAYAAMRVWSKLHLDLFVMYIDGSSRRPVMRSSGGHLFTDPKRTPKRVISKTFKNHQTSAFKSLKPFKNENSMFKQEIAMLSCFSFRPFSPKTNGIFSLPELGWPRGIGSLEHARLQQQGGRSEEFRKTSLDGFSKENTIWNIGWYWIYVFMIPRMFFVCLCPSLFSIFVKCVVPKCVHSVGMCFHLPSDKSIPWTSSQEPSSGAKPPPHIRSFSWIKEDSKHIYIIILCILYPQKRSRGFKFHFD